MKKLLLLLLCCIISYCSFAFTTTAVNNYRWRNDDGSETSATWRKPINTNDSLNQRNQNIRLRLALSPAYFNGSGTAMPASATLQLYCTSPSGTTFEVTSTSSQFQLAPTTNFTDGDSTTNQFGEGNFITGKCISTSSNFFYNSPDTFTHSTEVEWCIKATSSAVSGKYAFTISSTGGPVSNLSDTLTTDFTSTWTGVTSNDWSDSTNWLPAVVPNALRDVLVPIVSTNYPVLTGLAYDSVDFITVNAGASLSVQYEGFLDVGNDLINNGHIDINNTSAITIHRNLYNNSIFTSGDPAAVNNMITDTTGCIRMSSTSGSSFIYGRGIVPDIFISNTVTIHPGDSMYVKKHIMLDGSSTLYANGGLTMVADTDIQAQVNPIPSGSSIIGTVNVQNYIPGAYEGGERAFYFLGHPFSSAVTLSQLEQYVDITGTGGSANGFTNTYSNAPSSFYYNPLPGSGSIVNDSTGWIAFSSTADTWDPLLGIRVLIRGAKGQGLDGTVYSPSGVAYTLSGVLNQQDVSATLHKGDSSAYNMVSNPYCALLNLGNLIYNQSVLGGGTAIAGAAYWEWNTSMGTQGAYDTKLIASGAYDFFMPNGSFMVEAAADGVSLNFHESDKIIIHPIRTTNSYADYTELCVYTDGSKLWDKLFLTFNDNASGNKDNFDASKPQNIDVNFYAYSTDGKKLCVDALPYVKGNAIQLGFVTSLTKTYTISADKFSAPTTGSVYLHDKYLGQYLELAQGATYTFTVTSDKASQGDARFELTTEKLPGNLIASGGLDMNVGPNPAQESITVSYLLTNVNDPAVSITNSLGQQVYTSALGTAQSGSITIPVNEFAAGMYLIKITNGNKEKVQRYIKQ